MDRARYNFMFFLFLTLTQIFLFYVNLSHQSSLSNNFLYLNKRDAQAQTNTSQNTVGPLVCNGDASLCDLRYDQVTHPGTHNSAAYDLRLDCNQTVRNCLDSTSVCSKQYAECVVTYGMQCDAQTSACKQRNPQWLYWVCDGFNKTCRSNNAICAAWNAVCANSYKVCNVWADACEVDIPDWIITCFWENNPGFPILKQLQDGIRLFDLDTCLLSDGRAVFCHGMGPTRALGGELDPTFQAILAFLNANPNEVITMEFGDIDGDAVMISNYIQSKLAQNFIDPTTGHSMMYAPASNTRPWITLREMINQNTRIVVFFGRIYNNVQNRQPWIHYTYDWFAESYSYTGNDMTAEQITDSFIGYCSSSESIINNDLKVYGYVRWQTLDDTVGLIPPAIKEAIEMGKGTALCLKDLALAINFDVLKNIATYCYPKFPYYFRVRIDHYWQSSLFEVVKMFNELNVKKALNITTTTTTTPKSIINPNNPKS